MTRHIIVADAGGTSCRWAVTGTKTEYITTPGFNASVSPDEAIAASVGELADTLDRLGVTPGAIFFYGAGSHTPQGRERVIKALRARLGDIHIECESDLLGAARALHGDRPGVTCILGTGANAGVYDGSQVERAVAPLGYILGDEGSGAWLGKTFLQRLLRGQFPPEVTEHFHRLSDLDESAVIEHVYRRPGANTFLGSLCPIINELAVYPSVGNMIVKAFKAFRSSLGQPAIDKLMQHTASTVRPAVGFVGSVAHHFAPRLTEVFADCDTLILADPLPRLGAWHASRHR